MSNNNRNITYKITVEGKESQKTVQELTQGFDLVGKSVGDVNKRLKELKEAQKQAAVGSTDLKLISEEIARITVETKKAQGQFDELGRKEPLDKARKGFEDAQTSIAGLNVALNIAQGFFDKNSKAAEVLEKVTKGLSVAMSVLQLVKERNAIADGLLIARTTVLNALLPVTTALTTAFGVASTTAWAAATLGVSLLIAGLVTLIANFDSVLESLRDIGRSLGIVSAEQDVYSTAIKNTNTELNAQIESTERIIELREEIANDQDTITQLELELELLRLTNADKEELIRLELQIVEIKKESILRQIKENDETRKDILLKNLLINQYNELNVESKELNKNLKELGNTQKESSVSQQQLLKFWDDILKKNIEYAKKTNQLFDEISLLSLDAINKEYEDKKSAIIENGAKELEIRQKIEQEKQEKIKEFLNITSSNIEEFIKELESQGRQAITLDELFRLPNAGELGDFISNLKTELEKLSKFRNELDTVYRNGLLTEQEYIKEIVNLKEDEKLLIEGSIKSSEKYIQSIKDVNNELEKSNTSRIKTLELQKSENEEEIKNLELLIAVGKQEGENVFLAEVKLETLQNENKVLTSQINKLKQIEDSQSRFTKEQNRKQQKIQDFITKYEEEISVTVEGIQAINNIVSASFDLRLQKIQNEIDAVNERYDIEANAIRLLSDEESKRVENSLLSEEVKNDELIRLAEERDQELKKIENRREKDNEILRKKQLRAQQRQAISQAIIGASLAIIQSFAQLGPIAGAIAAAGIAVTTGIQIATIRRQKFAKGGIAKKNTGGMITGPGTGTSDSIPAMLSNGESVINSESTRRFRPVLSRINELGGGIPFNTGGIAGSNPRTNNEDIIDYIRLAETMNSVMTNRPIKTYVVAQDVTNEQQINAQIKRNSILF